MKPSVLGNDLASSFVSTDSKGQFVRLPQARIVAACRLFRVVYHHAVWVGRIANVWGNHGDDRVISLFNSFKLQSEIVHGYRHGNEQEAVDRGRRKLRTGLGEVKITTEPTWGDATSTARPINIDTPSISSVNGWLCLIEEGAGARGCNCQEDSSNCQEAVETQLFHQMNA